MSPGPQGGVGHAPEVRHAVAAWPRRTAALDRHVARAGELEEILLNAGGEDFVLDATDVVTGLRGAAP